MSCCRSKFNLLSYKIQSEHRVNLLASECSKQWTNNNKTEPWFIPQIWSVQVPVPIIMCSRAYYTWYFITGEQVDHQQQKIRLAHNWKSTFSENVCVVQYMRGKFDYYNYVLDPHCIIFDCLYCIVIQAAIQLLHSSDIYRWPLLRTVVKKEAFVRMIMNYFFCPFKFNASIT